MLTDKFRLDGKVAIVTGSGKGIGNRIGLTYAEAGARVVFTARTQKDIDAAVAKAKALGAEAIAIPCDVKDDAQLQALAEKTMAAFGRIDIVVNNAGGALPNQIEKTTRKQFNEAFDFNVTSAFSFTRTCVPHLRQSKGCVINITSAAGRVVQRNFTVYGSVKASLAYLTKMTAQDLAPDVRVNAIAPGSIMTDALRMFLDKASLQKMCDLTPMKVLGEDQDIALAALYLASPAAKWVTGKVFEIDGGMETTNMPF
ncbi:MAG: glucose 1-dehydrogenase [Chloroflexi bacterium]|nr:glucose 1-dehydrogenase [Chloroflexota bacterium]